MVALSNTRVGGTLVAAAGTKVIGALTALTWVLVDGAWIQRQMAQPILWPGSLPACALGAMFGQVALLCAWAVGSRQRQSVRLVATISGLCLTSFGCALTTDGPEHTGRWLTLLVVYSLLISVPLAAVRFSASSCDAPRASSRHAQLDPNRAWQFSIAGLFSGTTCVALLMGFSRWLELPNETPVSLLSFCLAIALLSLILLAISSLRRRCLFAALVTVLFCPLFGLLLPLTGLPPGGSIALSMMIAAQVTVVLGSVAAIRTAKTGRLRATTGIPPNDRA